MSLFETASTGGSNGDPGKADHPGTLTERLAAGNRGAKKEAEALSEPEHEFGQRAQVNSLTKSLSSYVHFFLAGLLKHGQTGGIVPSQKFLVEKMVSPIPEGYEGLVVELGAGSGALTLRLARRCPQAKILACEINPVLARDTRLNLVKAGFDHRVQVVAEPAEQVLGELQRKKTLVDFIVSGIPLGTLDRKRSLALIRCIHGTLAPGGLYIQFQHSLLDRKKIEDCFSCVRTVQAFLNFPPAVIYFAHK